MERLLNLPLKGRSESRPIQIRTTPAAPDRIGSEDEGLVCLVCHEHRSAYTCPTCYLRYCSMSCFQSHSVDCTERFSQARVETVLRFEEGRGEDYAHDDGALHLIADKLQQNGYDEKCLTADEQGLLAARLTAAKRRSISKSLPVRLPWWATNEQNDERPSPQLQLGFNIQEVIAPATTAVGPKKPMHPALVYQIVSLVISYSIAVRNSSIGAREEREEDELLELDHLFANTPSLSDATFQPASVVEVVEAWVLCTPGQRSLTSRSRQTLRAILADACILLRSVDFTARALLETWVLLCGRLGLCGEASPTAVLKARQHVAELVETYSATFVQPIPKSCDPATKLINQACRKAFCLLLYVCNEESNSRPALGAVFTELLEYCAACLF